MCETRIDIQKVEGDFYNVAAPENNVDSIINIIIGDIASAKVKIDHSDRSFPANVTTKIKHNMLNSRRRIILQYKSYSSHIERAYTLAEQNIINGKQSAMELLNEMYCNSLEKYGIDSFEPDITKVRQHADEIINDVIKQLRKFVYSSANVTQYKEQVEIGLNVVVAHAFVECCVLENPNHATD
ncbi:MULTISPECIES: ABC-three component system protein [Providencia]|uniref:ABC-three component system protein n=1 Tax=Providencia TaxID=586 RepID=UPI00235EFEC0|nr:ABC-three component system protein [Providencia rettgeri]